MRALKTLAIIATIAALGCGGGDDDDGNPTGPPGGGATNGTITGQINGATFGATGTITVTRQQNFIGLGATLYAGTTIYSIVIGIGNATGPGSHNLNLQAGGDGSSLIIGSTTTGYGTAFTGGNGTITITSLTSNRVVGTFSGTLPPSSGSASALVITNGAFDVTF